MQTELGQILRDKRNELKLSQNEFAIYLGLERSRYESIENNRVGDLKLETAIKLIKKLNLDLRLFIPEDILNSYFENQYVKNNIDIKKIIQREVFKLFRRIERKLKSTKSTE